MASVGERFPSFLQKTLQETAGPERQALLAELEAARSELAAARSARAALTAERFSVEESRMKDYASEIWTLSHSNATLQAQFDMANAHLKALAAMARSTASQVRSRQALLYGLLQQTEDLEASTLGEDCEEDPEERTLKERLHRLSISCSKLRGVKPSQHLEGDRPLTTDVRTPSGAFGTEQTGALSEEAQRLSQEISQLDKAAASLEEMHDVSAPALLELQQLRLHIPGSSLASLEALVSQVHELASLEEEMRSCNRENRLIHLRQEVAERQSHFGRMTHDLQAQVSHLQEEVRAFEHRRSSASVNIVNGELRELELLRQRELRHLRDQEEQLAQMERQDTDLSQPPEPLVDPVPDRLPRRMNPARQSQTRSADWQELSPTGLQFVQPRRPNDHGFEGAPLQGNRAASDVFRRHSDFEERVSELKAVIGSSLQSLAEEGWHSSDSGK